MASPFLIYFAGIGTVVAALAIGFGGGVFLSDPLKDSPRKDKPEITAKQDLLIATTPVTVRTPRRARPPLTPRRLRRPRSRSTASSSPRARAGQA